MGDLTLERFMNEFLERGFRMEFEHLGGGANTEITVKNAGEPKEIDPILTQTVPTNHLRDSAKLHEIRDWFISNISNLAQ